VAEVFAKERLNRINPKGDKPPAQSENNAEVDDATPCRCAVFDSPYESGNDKSEDVSFNFCFSVGVKIPHTKEWGE